MFKFSVSFATEVEKNRPSHGCFNRGLRSTKYSQRATGHLSPPTNNVRDLKSLLLSWKTCILVHLNGWQVQLSWFARGCNCSWYGCFNRGLRSTKYSQRATGHLSPPTNNVRDLKSLLLSWKTCILVHLNGWQVQLSWFARGCNCSWFFYFSAVCYK